MLAAALLTHLSAAAIRLERSQNNLLVTPGEALTDGRCLTLRTLPQ